MAKCMSCPMAHSRDLETKTENTNNNNVQLFIFLVPNINIDAPC